MSTQIHECQCAVCLEDKDSAECQQHHQMNVFLSRLDEQQRRWYVALEYPHANRLMILADAEDSNGCRPCLWKLSIQAQLADRLGLEVTVCHCPTGTSKWNPIEHRLFSLISINWAGKPLRTFEFLLACIRGAKTDTGLQFTATLIEDVYEKGIRIAKTAMDTLCIEMHAVCPRWNYTIRPRLSSV